MGGRQRSNHMAYRKILCCHRLLSVDGQLFEAARSPAKNLTHKLKSNSINVRKNRIDINIYYEFIER